MFLETITEYTNNEQIQKSEFEHKYLLEDQSTTYTVPNGLLIVPQTSYTGIEKISPAPENLKKAMFKASIRGIAQALK